MSHAVRPVRDQVLAHRLKWRKTHDKMYIIKLIDTVGKGITIVINMLIIYFFALSNDWPRNAVS
jgi:hypothetical protein